MAFIEVVGAIKLEPSVLKLEPDPVVEIHSADIYNSSDDEKENEDTKVDISETKIAEDRTEDQDEHRDNEFRATDNVREDERLMLNFNEKIPTDKPKKTTYSNWARVHRTRESANLLEDLKKVKKVYGSSWSKPIQPDEYTYKSDTSMTCNYCHREFHVKRNLAKHIRTIHRETSVTFHCPYCPKQSRWDLRTHILRSHKAESETYWFQCYECDKKFRQKKNLKKHVLIHSREVKESQATCSTCEQIFPNKRSMKIHVIKVHEKKHHCEICDYTGPDSTALKNHIEDEHRDIEFRATDNVRENESLVPNFNNQAVPVTTDKPEETTNSNWARVHRTRESANLLEDLKKVKKVYGSTWSKPIQPDEYTYKSDNSMTCNYCHREFHVKKNLAKHIRTIHRETSVTFHCPYCPKQSRWDLRTHIMISHKAESETYWFQCYECGKKFRQKNILKKHVRSHLGKVKESPATCPTCEQIFPSKRSMKIHVEKVHEKKHHCEICDYTGSSLSCIRNHIEVCHTDPRELPIHQCSKCDFKTRYKRSFTIHCRKHETQFCCEKCGHMTDSSGQLKLHENTHKTKIDDKTLRYQCKKCDYKTYRQYSLQVHELNHLKPEEINYFYCYHCDFKAKRKDNLKVHIKRHFKKEVTLQCFICDFKTKKRGKLTTHINRHQKSPQNKED